VTQAAQGVQKKNHPKIFTKSKCQNKKSTNQMGKINYTPYNINLRAAKRTMRKKHKLASVFLSITFFGLLKKM